MSGGSASPRWWEEDPDRLKAELEAIEKVSPIRSRDEEGDHYKVNTSLRFQGDEIDVSILFSPEHPYVAPVVNGPPRLLSRHQNPTGGNFCIVANIDHWWEPSSMAAELLEHLQQLLAATEKGEVEAGEYPIPEPISGYVKGRPNAVILIPDAMIHSEIATEGEFTVARLNDHQWAVTVFESGDDTWRLEPAIQEHLGVTPDSETARGGWTAIATPPSAEEIDQVHAAGLEKLIERIGTTDRGRRQSDRNNWAAVSFIEEAPQVGQQQRAWFFYETQTGPRGGINDPGVLIRSQALDMTIREQRIQELIGLSNVRFLVLGAGALGAPIVGELARADAARIDVIDRDVYDLNNSVRHPLPTASAGLDKAAAVADWANGLSPFTEVRAYDFTVGRDKDSRGQLIELVSEADVVVDTVGHHTLTRLLQRRASDARKVLVSTAISPGGYGGRVVVFRGSSPCFDCYQSDERIERAQQGPDELVTPYGCSHPAASAAGFDVLEVAALAARVAVQASEATNYPPLDFDWVTVNTRPTDAPRWTQGRLTYQVGCGCR